MVVVGKAAGSVSPVDPGVTVVILTTVVGATTIDCDAVGSTVLKGEIVVIRFTVVVGDVVVSVIDSSTVFVVFDMRVSDATIGRVATVMSNIFHHIALDDRVLRCVEECLHLRRPIPPLRRLAQIHLPRVLDLAKSFAARLLVAQRESAHWTIPKDRHSGKHC